MGTPHVDEPLETVLVSYRLEPPQGTQKLTSVNHRKTEILNDMVMISHHFFLPTTIFTASNKARMDQGSENMASTKLVGLPQEIKDQIYGQSLVANVPLRFPGQRRHDSVDNNFILDTKVLLVSRRVYGDVFLVFFRASYFAFNLSQPYDSRDAQYPQEAILYKTSRLELYLHRTDFTEQTRKGIMPCLQSARSPSALSFPEMVISCLAQHAARRHIHCVTD